MFSFSLWIFFNHGRAPATLDNATLIMAKRSAPVAVQYFALPAGGARSALAPWPPPLNDRSIIDYPPMRAVPGYQLEAAGTPAAPGKLGLPDINVLTGVTIVARISDSGGAVQFNGLRLAYRESGHTHTVVSPVVGVLLPRPHSTPAPYCGVTPPGSPPSTIAPTH